MSSKSAPSPKAKASTVDGRPWSLATRLTLWFFLSSFALVLAATGYLYWALARNLDREDDHFLTDRARGVLALLRERPTDQEAIRKQIAWAGAALTESTIYLRVLKDDGQVVAETPGMADRLPSSVFAPAQADLGDALSGTNHRSGSGRWFRVLAVQTPIDAARGEPLVVQVAMDRSHEEELLEDYRRNLWIVLGVALILCSVGGFEMIRRGIRPVKNIAATAARIRSSTLNERITRAGLPAELRTLADTFNDMLDRLESSFDRLSRFSADIAHELRTPLNNLRGEAEVALSRPRSFEEYRDVIGSALEEYGRLARLIDSLLFLARAENPATQIARDLVDVGTELERLREYYEATAAEAQVRLAVACPASITAKLDRTLLQRAVGNLVENALAHTPPHGAVTLTALSQDGWLSVELSDTGHGIDPGHLPHLFERFYRADRARKSRKGGSVGLGLAIVKSIAELHGGTVGITSKVGQGTQVVLRLPLVSPCPADNGSPASSER
jgi:two-component system heavy metal sensor histidine kinase CusS